MNADHYIITDTYRIMLDRLEAAHLDPGHDLRTKLIEIIGEAGIWPDYCRPTKPTLHVTARGLNTLDAPSVISLANAKAA